MPEPHCASVVPSSYFLSVPCQVSCGDGPKNAKKTLSELSPRFSVLIGTVRKAAVGVQLAIATKAAVSALPNCWALFAVKKVPFADCAAFAKTGVLTPAKPIV